VQASGPVSVGYQVNSLLVNSARLLRVKVLFSARFAAIAWWFRAWWELARTVAAERRIARLEEAIIVDNERDVNECGYRAYGLSANVEEGRMRGGRKRVGRR
jgi:hypothetical protein